eukprot:CAMPEP_0119311018 /NCGR_PEP_ID=MMETSP1333-20130426/21154_1 /TAXON_ID=418940 /ORGANISM="Scyphosphaera apsteinii, Strain RCC1455" /LENGTH=52 /DNA_ID=CAMNT_0007315299 /DNA_START=270 /DNA_END=428 /DNA_ORIENTATION=-
MQLGTRESLEQTEWNDADWTSQIERRQIGTRKDRLDRLEQALWKVAGWNDAG